MRSKDMNLSVLFHILDTNSNEGISLPEFRTKTKAIGLVLDEQETNALYRDLDKDGSASITYKEVVDSFSQLNTEFLLKKMQRIITGSGTGPEFYFNRYAVSDTSKKQMRNEEFAKLAKELNEKVMNIEISHLYRHFDATNKGYIT